VGVGGCSGQHRQEQPQDCSGCDSNSAVLRRRADGSWAESEDVAAFFHIFGLFWSVRKIPE